MTVQRTTYVSGQWTAVSAPGGWLLVDEAPDADLVRRAWDTLSSGGGVEDVLDALIAKGVRATPPFALLRVSDAERRLVVRGKATAVVRAAGTQVTRSAAASQTWADEMVAPDVVEIVLTSGGGDSVGAALPLSAGVTAAAEVRIELESASAQPPSAIAVTLPMSATAADAADLTEVDGAGGLDPAPQPLSGSSDIEEVPAAVPVQAGGASYDYLFGATQRPPRLGETDADLHPETTTGSGSWPSVPSVPSGAPVPSVSTLPVDVGRTAGWKTAGLPAPELVRGEPLAPPTGVIDDVPWARSSTPSQPTADMPQWPPPPSGQAVAPPAMSMPAAPALPPHAAAPGSAGAALPPTTDVMRTTNRAALLAAASASEQPSSGPTVLAGRCPSGHLSPPHAARCRVCQTEMPPQDAIEIARPPLGVLRLTTGDVVTLDRGVLLGRAPEAPANVEERPHLLRVVSPDNDVSRNHAEIVLDGWHVFVRDLGSTNGTTVTLPGGEPIRLRDHDMQLLEHGAVVTLADEVSCTFEIRG